MRSRDLPSARMDGQMSTKTMATTMKEWAGVLLATMLAAGVAAQSPAPDPLEPLFRAGVVVSTTFRDNPVQATVQPLKVEAKVAGARATTDRDKKIVSAYTLAMLDLDLVAMTYEFSLKSATSLAESKAKTAAMRDEMERMKLPGSPRPGTVAAAAQAKQDKELLALETDTATKTAQREVKEQYLPKIEAALKKLEDAQALYTAKPAAAKPATGKK